MFLTKCYSGDEIKEDEMARHLVYVGEERNAYRNLVVKSEGRSPVRSLGHRWEGKIKILRKGNNMGRTWNVLMWLMTGTSGGLF